MESLSPVTLIGSCSAGRFLPEERAHAELVPARVERRVGQHRDARELELVQGRHLRVVPPAAAHKGNAALVLEVVELVLEVVFREDGVRGADERAGAAADAVAVDLGALADHLGQPAGHLRLGARTFRRDDALRVDRRLDGLHRADGRAAAAAGAAVLAPLDDIGKLLERELMVLV